MSAKFLTGPGLLAAALMAMATAAMADAPPRTVALVKITPAMIRQASEAAQPPKDQAFLLREASPLHDNIHISPKNLEHMPNGCTRKSGSLCYDYRTGHAVYKPVRKLLPGIPGMTPHNLSIRRDKIVAQYTFK